MIAIPAKPKPAYRTLLALAVVFFLPFAAGSGLFWSGWRPGAFAHHGELLQPPLALPTDQLRTLDGQTLPMSDLRGKWLLLLPTAGACNAGCQEALQQMLQVYRALAKERTRVLPVVLALATRPTAGDTELPATPPGDAALRVLRAEGQAGHRLVEGRKTGIFIVDPAGNVMMHYPAPIDGRGALKDLERLLKYSWTR